MWFGSEWCSSSERSGEEQTSGSSSSAPPPAPRPEPLLKIKTRSLHRTDWNAQKMFLASAFPEIFEKVWKCGEVHVVAGVEDPVDPMAFAVGFGTYVYFNVNTARVGRAMKARDILKEVWNTYNASLANLDTVAYWLVTNGDVKAAIQIASEVLIANNSYITEGWNTVRPGGLGWNEAKTNNPLIIGIEKLLKENAFASGYAFILDVQFSWQRLAPGYEIRDWSDYELFMKINLSR
ncbi:hypothetical protein DL766_010013 [Monosporascus sp. MC13-8B]|uniref:Uncharacterized protein n=1 Tax=Monosporascus cannonballus TaxID=155416 RepID=A0ABY0GV90_9PEZI|nr:hypothetical protein DL762_010547 [Monosporascus cannonballus]RYO78238.1 hypothetical protein DL763_009735 [Monosporascus cannonballus]RYP11807.1 hypothetical protein DL766_010013 [Monosporascus sp. MC13-8B]